MVSFAVYHKIKKFFSLPQTQLTPDITEKKLCQESVKWRVCGAMSSCTREFTLALVIIVCA